MSAPFPSTIPSIWHPVTRIEDARDALAGGQANGPIPLWMFQRIEAAADNGGHPFSAGVEGIGVGQVVPVFGEGVVFVHPGPIGFGEARLGGRDVLGWRGVADVEVVGPFERGVVGIAVSSRGVERVTFGAILTTPAKRV